MKTPITKYVQLFLVFSLLVWAMVSCAKKVQYFPIQLESHLSTLSDGLEYTDEFIDPLQISIEAESIGYYLPAIQSAAVANYNGLVVLIGGRKEGLHSMNNYPIPFNSTLANDSIWVVDFQNGKTIGVPIPTVYKRYLSATNQQYYQVGDTFYTGGGFTVKDSISQFNNWTSDRLFEINLPNLIQYAQSHGAVPVLDEVFTKVIQSPFLQVTGGEMMVVNNNFYLIGGQNYVGRYIPGNDGVYTNAIRKFEISNVNSQWVITDTLSIVDQQNLRRRDFNLAEVIKGEIDSLGAVIYGGVFTKDEMAYRSPVYISGLVSGNPVIQVDTTMLQKVNLYTSAKIEAVLPIQGGSFNHITFLGGISYMKYDSASKSLIVPEDIYKLPFSDLISSYMTNGQDFSYEMIQLPPNQVLPGYLGSNANFIALPQFIYSGSSNMIDLNRVFPETSSKRVHIGYFYGGIQSPAPTTVAPDSNHKTMANSTLYKVFMEIRIPDE